MQSNWPILLYDYIFRKTISTQKNKHFFSSFLITCILSPLEHCRRCFPLLHARCYRFLKRAIAMLPSVTRSNLLCMQNMVTSHILLEGAALSYNFCVWFVGDHDCLEALGCANLKKAATATKKIPFVEIYRGRAVPGKGTIPFPDILKDGVRLSDIRSILYAGPSSFLIFSHLPRPVSQRMFSLLQSNSAPYDRNFKANEVGKILPRFLNCHYS